MVERLKEAIEKARMNRAAAQPAAAAATGAPSRNPAAALDHWSALPEMRLDPAILAEHRIVTVERTDPAHGAFDMLRGQLLKLCVDHGWRRIGVTSPTKGCGKTVTVANLALSLARADAVKTLVVDFDLRAPMLGRALGQTDTEPFEAALLRRTSLLGMTRRYGGNLAATLNGRPIQDPSTIMHNASTFKALIELETQLQPTVMLFDLPPILVADETIAALSAVDAALLVAAAGQTSAREVEQSGRLMKDICPLIGVVFNKFQDGAPDIYGAYA